MQVKYMSKSSAHISLRLDSTPQSSSKCLSTSQYRITPYLPRRGGRLNFRLQLLNGREVGAELAVQTVYAGDIRDERRELIPGTERQRQRPERTQV